MYSLNYYCGMAREAIQNDNERDDIYQKIHEATACVFETPPELRALPWIQDRKFVSTAPSDALNAAIRTFATRNPKIEIQPLSEMPEEYRRVDDLEQAMTWEFKRMNLVMSRSPHWKIVEYAMKYCAVAIETSYLPWVYQNAEKTPRVKEILRSRHFRWNVHDPSMVHVRESDDILECVVVTSLKCAAELVDMFGRDHPGVREMLSKIDEQDPAALYNTWYTLYDLTDWDCRCKWISESPDMFINREAPEGIELMRKERTMPFLPWVFVDNKEPLLKQMVMAGLWDNVNILRTMQFSKAVDMAAHPEYWIQTPDGTLRNVSIDNSNPNQPLVSGPGVNVTKLQPPSIDPQMAQITGQAESEVFRTTVAQILASVEKYAGTQNFSVVNAMLNAAVAQLSLAQVTAERAETMAMIQNFRWIEETNIPMVAFRETSKGDDRPKGQELVIRKGKAGKGGGFDTQYLYLTVKLNPSSMMDKQTEINNAINKVERLGMSKEMAWDELGIENFSLSQSQVSEELLYTAFLQGKAQELLKAAEMKAQAKAQAQVQAEANPEAGGPQSQFSGQQGIPGAQGAPSTMPGQGREQLNAQSAAGQGMP